MTEDRKIKILCVEDEQDIRENIAEILRDEGFEVFEAANGKEGFDVFLNHRPDLVISDIMMPELDGYGLLQLIRESKNTRNNMVPFIFLSALGQKNDVIKGVNLSANDYLVKPIDFDLMVAKVKEKTTNAIKVQEVYDRNIQNIKTQVSAVLSSDLFSYLDIITRVSSILKQEPYGPFPHRRYLEDIDKIYINSMKIRSAIANSLDKSVIDHKLNAEEEVFSITTFMEEFISDLSEKFKNRIEFEPPFEAASIPNLKMDKLVLLDGLRKIFSGLFKSALDSSVNVRVIFDHLNQMVLIFYLKSQNGKIDIRTALDEAQIRKILEKQSCRFEVVYNKENTAILTIPSYRLISN